MIKNLLLRFLFLAFAATPLIAQETRLSNVAVRTSAGGGDLLITGFTIGPGPTKRVLIRAVGPTLANFGVPGVLADPKLELFNAAGTKVTDNDNWTAGDAATFSTVGAFPLGALSKDAALVTDLAPGGYTVQVTGAGGRGVALVEVYEVSGVTRLVNLSTRAQVGTGASILIPGISVAPGVGKRRLLVRAVGPTLGSFGVPGTLVDPKLELFSGSTKIAENDNWGTPVGAAADAATLTSTFANNGAFPLTAGSKDAALLVSLGAGGYTLQVSGVGDTTGEALVEVYDLTPITVTPAITRQPVATSTGVGQNGVFTVEATGTPEPLLQWRREGVPIAGATGSTLRVFSVTTSDAGSYDVVATNIAGTATSNPVALTVTGAGNTLVRLQASATGLDLGQSTTFTATIAGATATSYFWRRNGAEVRAAAGVGSRFTLNNATIEDAGTYTVQATTSAGTVLSNAVTLVVGAFPTELTLTGGQFFTTTAEGTEIAGLHAFAPDGSTAFTYNFVAGAGDTDNARFRIVGSKLCTAVSFAGEARTAHTVRVRATGPGGVIREKAFTLRLVDARGIAAVFRVVNTIPLGPPFPVVEAWLSLDLDLESAVVSWLAELDATYAVEYSTDGATWRLHPQARSLRHSGSTGVFSFTDLSSDFQLRQRFYRVRKVSVPIGADNAIEPPSVEAIAAVPALRLNADKEIIASPEFIDQIVDPTGQADYFEVYTPGSIGPQARVTSPSLALNISANYTQGQALRLSVFGYTWGGRLVTALSNRAYRVRFTELNFPSVPNHYPALPGFGAPIAGIVNVYGSAADNSFSFGYGGIDRSSGSRIYRAFLDRSDGSDPNYGGFTLLLPQGLIEGVQPFTSTDAYNRSSTGACLLETTTWKNLNSFRFTSLGPNAVDSRSYGSFEIRRTDRDAFYDFYEIKVNYAGSVLGSIYYLTTR